MPFYFDTDSISPTTGGGGSSGGGSETYEADLIFLGVVDGLPQPTEEEVVDDAVAIFETI